MANVNLYSKLDPDADPTTPAPVLDDATIVRGDGVVLAELVNGRAIVDDAVADELCTVRGDLSLTPDVPL